MLPYFELVIVVATDNFQVYHEVVTDLRNREIDFTTITPDSRLPDEAQVVITGPADPTPAVPSVQASPEAPRKAVEKALEIIRGDSGRRIIGIDPGARPGIAVLQGDTVTAAFHVPIDQVPSIIEKELDSAPNPLIRIGDGARLQGAKLIDKLPDVRLELVDETGSTPYLGSGARGMGDILAAVNIAQRDGTPIESREIEPTAGEIQLIKNQSRKQSSDDRTIPGTMARRVAIGELTLEEAIDMHRNGTDGPADATT